MWTIVKKNMKIIKTCNLYLSMITLGLSYALTGPCLLDLQRIVGTDTQHIALIYTSRSIGYLVGAILGGVVLDMVRSKLSILTACNFFVAVTMFGIPWSRNVETLLVFGVINGLSLGAIETGTNVVCIQLWGAGPFLQALCFTFGIGGFISPLIAAPFLENQRNVENLSNTTYMPELGLFENATSNFSSYPVYEGIANITYPFSIVGVCAVVVTILFLVTCLISPTEDCTSQTDKESNSNRSFSFIFGTVIFTFLIFFVITGTEIGFGQTLTTYAVKGPLHVTTTVGSYMTSAYWASFTVMRFLSVFISIKVSSMTLVIIDLCIIAVSGVLLLFFMPNEWTLWAASVTYGAGVASSYASLIGWLDNYIEITNRISSIFIIGGAAGEMVVPFIITYFMEIIPEMFAYVTALSSILSTILLLFLYGIVKNGNKKCTKKETEVYVVNNEAVLS